MTTGYPERCHPLIGKNGLWVGPVNEAVQVYGVGGEQAVAYTYDDIGSFQISGNDLVLDPNAGRYSAAGSAYLAPYMGNIYLRDDLTSFSHTYVASSSADTLTITNHGLETGDGPFEFIAGSGALPAGVSASTSYWAIRVDNDTIKVATSKANAEAGTAVDLTTAGTTHSTRLFKKIIAYMPGTGNYLAGVIGKYNVEGEVKAKYPTGGVVGEIGESASGTLTSPPDGCVVAVVGGDDAAVKPTAYFKARHLNSNSGSGPSYGLDLYDEKASGLGYGQGTPTKADIRFAVNAWLVFLDTAITANSTTTTAPAGSLGFTIHATGKGKIFYSDGTKWQFAAIS